MITVVLWKWGTLYGVENLTRMRSMLFRHLSLPHRITVITDSRRSVPKGMGYLPIRRTVTPGYNRHCMCRMWIYSKDAKVLGDRLLQMDLDVVITDSLDPLFDRPDPFIIWRADSAPKPPQRTHNWAYNPTLLLLNAGARSDIWDAWRKSPARVYRAAEAAGWDPFVGSDQSIVSYLLEKSGQPPATWAQADGIHGFRVFAGKRGRRGETLPDGCRFVSFHGRGKERQPSSPHLQALCPWINEHWR